MGTSANARRGQPSTRLLLNYNRGERPINISDYPKITLTDASGQRYFADPSTATVTGYFPPSGLLLPSEKMRGRIGFLVPNDAADLRLLAEDQIIADLGDDPPTAIPPAPSPSEATPPCVDWPAAADLDGLKIAVSDYQFATSIGDRRPLDGYRFVTLTVSFENMRAHPVAINAISDAGLKDDAQYVYRALTGGDLPVYPDQVLSPGQRVLGQIVFQVPANRARLTFTYDDSEREQKAFVCLP